MSMMDLLKPKRLFKARVPKDLNRYVGKEILIPTTAPVDGVPTVIATEKVRIETIVGNRFKPQYFEINGTHLIGMLRFFAQINGVKDITEDQFQKFENMEMEAEKLPPQLPKGPKESEIQ